MGNEFFQKGIIESLATQLRESNTSPRADVGLMYDRLFEGVSSSLSERSLAWKKYDGGLLSILTNFPYIPPVTMNTGSPTQTIYPPFTKLVTSMDLTDRLLYHAGDINTIRQAMVKLCVFLQRRVRESIWYGDYENKLLPVGLKAQTETVTLNKHWTHILWQFIEEKAKNESVKWVLCVRPEIELLLRNDDGICSQTEKQDSVILVVDDHIPEYCEDGDCTSDMYLLRLRRGDNSPLLYCEYVDYRAIPLPDNAFWSDYGIIQWSCDVCMWDVMIEAQTEQRIVGSGFRIADVKYSLRDIL